MSKRVLYISQYYPPEVGAGAVRSKSIVNTLGQDDWNVDVICEVPNYPIGKRFKGYEKGNLFIEQESDNVTIHRVWVRITKRRHVREQLSLFLSFMASIFFYALRLNKKYDIIYCTSPPLFSGFSALILSKFLKAKFVFEVRDLWPDSAKDSFKSDNSVIFKLGLWMEKIIYRGADLIISVTEEAKKIILQKSPNSKVKVVHNGVDTTLFRPIPKHEIQIDEDIDDSKFIVGYVGSLGVIHDLDTLVRAAKLCEVDPDIHFVIVGDGGRNNMLNKILEEINPNNITWVGLKPYEKIPHYISSFSLAANPMKDKKIFDSVITVKFYEYMACGVPVITSDLKSVSMLADTNKRAITVKASDEHELFEAIIDAKKNPEALSELAKLSLDFVRSKFERDVLAKQISDELSLLSHE